MRGRQDEAATRAGTEQTAADRVAAARFLVERPAGSGLLDLEAEVQQVPGEQHVGVVDRQPGAPVPRGVPGGVDEGETGSELEPIRRELSRPEPSSGSKVRSQYPAGDPARRRARAMSAGCRW